MEPNNYKTLSIGLVVLVVVLVIALAFTVFNTGASDDGPKEDDEGGGGTDVAEELENAFGEPPEDFKPPEFT